MLEVVEGPEPAWLDAVADRARRLAARSDPILVAEEPPMYLGDGCWAFVQDFVEGCSLDALLAESEVPGAVALGIVAQVADGLHRVGIPHGQLRTSCVHITTEGEVRVEGVGAHLGARGSEDVPALGRILQELLRGSHARPAASLARELQASSLTLREVGPRCTALRASTPAALATWAAGVPVIAAPEVTPDDLCGTDLEEQLPLPRLPPSFDPDDDSASAPLVGAPPAYVGDVSATPPPATAAASSEPPSSRSVAPLVAVALGALGLGLAGAAAALVVGVATWMMWSTRDDPHVVASAEEPALPSLTEGFAVAPARPTTPPIDPLRDAPEIPPDVVSDVVAEAVQPDIEVGIGRAAVIRLDVRPRAFRITPYLDLTALPPYLVISAARGGLFTLTVEHDSGEREWVVSVHGTTSTDPTGSGIVAASERITLPIGEGALCTLARPAETVVLVDPDRATVEALDDRTFYLQIESAGVVDAVFEGHGDAPRVVTLDATGDSGDALPRDCTRADPEPLRVPFGAELTVPIGVTAQTVHVGDPEVADVFQADQEPRSVVIRAGRRGTTTVTASDGKGGRWLRRLLVE